MKTKRTLFIICLILISSFIFSETEENYPPNAVDDYYEINENETLNVSSPGILENDEYSDNDISKLKVEITNKVEKGFLKLKADGTFRYTPEYNLRINQDEYYNTVQFSYRIFDGIDYSNEAIVTITINQVNDPPQCMDDFYITEENKELIINTEKGILQNDSDPEGDELSAVLVSDVTNGLLNLNDDGSFTYFPHEGFSGTDDFTYYITDGEYDSHEALVNIDVMASDDDEISEIE